MANARAIMQRLDDSVGQPADLDNSLNRVAQVGPLSRCAFHVQRSAWTPDGLTPPVVTHWV